MKKVLLLYADVGSGHRIAMQALQAAIAKRSDALEYVVQAVDIFAELDVAPFNTSNSSHELFTSNYTLEGLASFVWRVCNTFAGNGVLRAYVEGRLKEDLKVFLLEQKPDLIICAHPMVAMALSELKNELGFKYTIAVTDLVTMMRGWHDQNADIVFAPTLEAKQTMIERMGAICPRVEAPFFPLRQNYLHVAEKSQIMSELKFTDPARLVIGITGGGVGTKILTGVVRDLAALNKYNLIVFTGDLRFMRESLERRYRERSDIRVFGFVDNIYDYFNACDILIAKPSATTVIELTAMQKPTVFSKYLMENDKGNVDYLLTKPWFRYAGSSRPKLLEQVTELSEYMAQKPDLKPDASFTHMVDFIVDESLKLLA